MAARLTEVSRAQARQARKQLFLAPGVQKEILFSTAGPETGAVMSPRRVRRAVAEAERASNAGCGPTCASVSVELAPSDDCRLMMP